ncbi:MAG: methylated-DNA--[protein]-cysteine S-methyltransferase [Propionibacteriaceae bacterium]|jgi:methylated-DNA-[protein]-cysteine S-methyltransferase|nr:methylated-DNA--[protein]-cysteine S-methyltransferase [Propionibacteriaceae bacterium]
MSKYRHCACDTPGGTLSVVFDPDAAVVVAAGYFGVEPLLEQLGDGVAAEVAVAPKWLADPMAAYNAGDIAAIDRVPVRQPGTPFRQAVWRTLREHRAPLTYGELAAQTVAGMGGSAGAPAQRLARAVGSAMSHNLVAFFVPCHRVVPAGGGVGAYGFGPPVKEALLAFEAAHL